ncbi:MAG: ferrochelatase [Desulfobacteraceae bacterium]|nr:ferrochelatase [Desulfobacteraceae bacterium]
MADRVPEPIGVMLLNLGGPERLEDVEPFLVNLFSDRQIIRLGPFPFLQKPIARRIAHRRAPKSREAYRLIGGGSPLARITGEQCRALGEALAPAGSFTVRPAMRYWPPFASQTLAELRERGICRLVALPLYPHYSVATSGSSLSDLRRAAAAAPPSHAIEEIRSWPEQPDYVACLAENILQAAAASPQPPTVVYSAHSLPVKFIREGDPYVEELEKTITAVEAITRLSGRLCFQSRSGPVRWLEPSTPDMLARLAAEGCRQVLMVPLSFISDHVETDYEIDILYREQAEGLGMGFARTRSLNTQSRFIAGLRELVLAACRRRGWN